MYFAVNPSKGSKYLVYYKHEGPKNKLGGMPPSLFEFLYTLSGSGQTVPPATFIFPERWQSLNEQECSQRAAPAFDRVNQTRYSLQV